MISLKTVLCPVDFSAATPRQIDLAVDVCRAFGTRLVLHHNRHALGTGASVGWMWAADHHGKSRSELEARLSECMSRVPPDLATQPLITEGPVSRAVLAVADAVSADLIVLTAHGTMADDHASITEQMLEHSQRSVLVLHETAIDSRTPHFAAPTADCQVVVAPTDLTPESDAAIEFSFDLVRSLPVELHLLHLLAHGRSHRHGNGAADQARRQLRAMVPDELVNRVQLHVEIGDPVHGIARVAAQTSASCIVMGEHSRVPLRRWFSRDTSRAVLHEAPCPVWYVRGGTSSQQRNSDARRD